MSSDQLNIEKLFGTGKLLSVFHAVTDPAVIKKMKFDGVLLGFEKIKNKKLSLPKKSYGFDGKQKTYDLDINSFMASNDMTAQSMFAKTILSHPKSLVLTHTVKTKGDIQKLDYNIYGEGLNKFERAYDLYQATKEQLNLVAKYVSNQSDSYTHIFVMSTGWNNNQEDSLKFYSEWYANTKKIAAENSLDYKPFIIGISWPSFWGIKIGFDMPNKADDADEIGITHINYFIWKCLMAQKSLENKKIVVIGHSFGARLLTRAAHSYRYFKSIKKPRKIDFLFSLQGAYMLDRHYNKGGRFNSLNIKLYTNSDPCNKFVATTSKSDDAMDTARHLGIGLYIGDDESRKEISMREKDTFDLIKVDGKGDLTISDHGRHILDCDQIIDSHGDVENMEICNLILNYLFS